FFSFIRGTSGDWVVNSSDFDLWPPFGDGTDLAAYNCCGFGDLDIARRVELVANVETVAVVMDGVKGGEAPFLVKDVSFGFGVYALGPGDTVDAVFDNARILGDSNTFGVGCEGKVPLTFVRGDADSNGSINLTDGIVILNFLFLGAAAPACLDAADTDDDGGERPSLTDAVIIFSWLFSGGPPPAAPRPDAPNYVAENCGPDVTDDAMDCAMLSPVCQ
ncbi:MAG: hypothetical protein O7J95_17940, partial [Planctomycetota bacterium]|nr:hypothetical protein [Planctomycetota bacterium]